MYEIIKDSERFILCDELILVKKNRNDIYIPVEQTEAEGVVIGNDVVEPIGNVDIYWFDGANRINLLNTAGAEIVQTSAKSSNTEPSANAGVFTYDEWRENTDYEQYDMFTYKGNAYFAKQKLTSSFVFPPDALGVEALYGIRPTPDAEGVYPYMQNMAVTIGMKVRSAKDDNVYVCYANATNTLVYDPVDAPAIFNKV